jgi:hypothetical protein
MNYWTHITYRFYVHEYIKNLNKPLIINEIESVTKSLPTKQSSEINGFTAEFYWAFKEIMPIIFEAIPNNCRGGNACKFIPWG